MGFEGFLEIFGWLEAEESIYAHLGNLQVF